MKPSCKKIRWSVISLCLGLALLVLLAGWFFKADDLTTGPVAQTETEMASAAEPSQQPAAGAAVEQAKPSGADAAPVARRASREAAGWVRRLEHPEESPAWAVRYGQEFWRAGQQAVGEVAEAGGDNSPAGLNLNLREAVERVRHAWMADDGGREPQVRSRTYTATLDEEGVGFSPHRPAEPSVAAAQGTAEVGAAADGNGPQRRQAHGARSAALAMGQPDPETAVRFTTDTVTRDGRALFAAGQAARSWVVLGNTAQSLLNEGAGLVEYYEARNEGIEVSWVLQQPVAGSGPLVVEAKLEGLSYAGQTDQGHHFTDADGVARVKVGHVTVADAAGQRWEVAMGVDGNRLRVEVPEEILGQATYPVAIDPALEAEFGMDNPVVSPALGGQLSPAVAGGTSGFLVVWEDRREQAMVDIYGARVTSAGVVSDPNGIAICTASGKQYGAAVAASGTNYLVVWEDERNGAVRDIYGARVTGAGVVSDPSGLAICTAANDQAYPSVAASGGGYLVAWEDFRDGVSYDIYGARVTSAGVVSEPNGIPICMAGNGQVSPAVAANATGFLVVWEDYRQTGFPGAGPDIYAARVTTAGVVSDADGIPICTAAYGQESPAVAGSASGYLVVWEDHRTSWIAGSDIYGARVTSAGVVSDPGGRAICTVTNDQTVPAVAASGSGYLVAWEDYRRTGFPGAGSDIYGARVTSAGAVSDPNGLAIGRGGYSQSSPAVAASGSGYLVVWEDGRQFWVGTDIYGARVSSGGAVTPAGGAVISTRQNAQQYPAVAASGTNYLVVWQDDRHAGTTGWDIYGVRVTGAGVVSDPNGLAIGVANKDQALPVVASNGNGYLVAWMDARNDATTGWDIYGTRVSTAGAVLDPGGIAICTAPNGQGECLAVASCGSDYLVVWTDSRTYNTWHIYGARVTSGGAVSDPNGIPICTAAGGQCTRAVAANGSGYLVVWEDSRNAGSTGTDVYGARVSPAGTVLDPGGFAICRAALEQHLPCATANGGGYLVAWADSRNGRIDIYAGRVPSSGGVLDGNGFCLGTAAAYPGWIALAADGTNYIVAWTDGASGLCRRRISSAGTVLDSTALAVNGSSQRDLAALAYGGAGRFLLVSQGTRNGVDRAVGALVTAGRPAPGPVLAFQSATFQVSETGRLATITVALTGTNPGMVGANYFTSDSTAVSPFDYLPASGTLWFGSGQTRQTFTVPVVDNAYVNADKTVNLALSTPTGGATLGMLHRAALTIKNDDVAGQLRFAPAAYAVSKSAGSVTLTVTRSGGLANVSVTAVTGGGTAAAGVHYAATSRPLGFNGGATSQPLTIPILNYPAVEGPKTFYVTLYNPASGSALGSPAVATVTINDY